MDLQRLVLEQKPVHDFEKESSRPKESRKVARSETPTEILPPNHHLYPPLKQETKAFILVFQGEASRSKGLNSQ